MRTINTHQTPGAETSLTVTVNDTPSSGNASNSYFVGGLDTRTNASEIPGEASNEIKILFQSGPITEHGQNGLTIETLLAICADRLACFQAGPFACRDNEEAKQHIEAAKECLQRRTLKRVAAGKEGTLIP